MAWITDMPDSGEFSRVRVEVNRILDDEDLQRAAGCVGYAFAKNLRGESLGEPENITRQHGVTAFECYYDSTKSRVWNVEDALDEAVQFILEGTPIRTTNRSGPGTKGTRLVEGVGASARVFVDAPDTERRFIQVYINNVLDRVIEFDLPVGSVVKTVVI